MGKAKDLKKRVSTYFTARANDNRKLMVMVGKIADIKHVVVDTEADADGFNDKQRVVIGAVMRDDIPGEGGGHECETNHPPEIAM